MTLTEYQNAKGDRADGAKYLVDYAADGSEKPVPGTAVGALAGGLSTSPTCPWVDEAIQKLKRTLGERNELNVLRGQPLARKWQEVDDPALKEQALEDIKARWQAKGWWDDPRGRAARRAKRIYEGNT